MPTVNTVLGPVDTADLGFTLSHEHIIETSAGIQQVYPEFIDREGTLSKAVTELKQAYEEGVRTLVDLTTMDLGRDVRFLERVSGETGINIIVPTGIWMDIPRVFRWSATPDMIAPLFIREIEEGIEGTGIKAGVIKAASDRGGVTPEGEVILRAAARAHKATGAPISTHAWAPDRVGEEQVRILEDEGVDLDRVYIGHSNDTTDMDYLLGLLEKGVWLGLDRYPGSGIPGTIDAPDRPGWERRTEVAKALIDAGYGDRLMLSIDWTATLTTVTKNLLEARAEYNPDGYMFINRKVLPRLRELGATEEQVLHLTTANPRRFFEGSSGAK